jgi:carnitine O-acetyltransferase
LEGLQDADEHERTKAVVEEFLSSGEGAKWQQKLLDYDASVDSYIEEFWCERGAAQLGRELTPQMRVTCHILTRSCLA